MSKALRQYYFCTDFDQGFLKRGLALYHSLREHCPGSRLWILCWDDIVYQTLANLKLSGVHLISLKELELDNEPLRTTKTIRSTYEYFATARAALLLYVLNHWPEVDIISRIDADLFFFSSPAPLFEEMAKGSIGIIGHRFSRHCQGWEICGIYNAGWVSFRRDADGFACLQYWRDRCIEWCYRVSGDGRYAEQKYLDDWPTRFRNVVVLEHKGANVAPWNLADYHLSLDDKGAVEVDGQPLIFFHFHNVKKIKSWLYDPQWSKFGIKPSSILCRQIYGPYVKMLSGIGRLSPPAQEPFPVLLKNRRNRKKSQFPGFTMLSGKPGHFLRYAGI